MSLQQLTRAEVVFDEESNSVRKFNDSKNLLEYKLACHSHLKDINQNPKMYASNAGLVEKLNRILDSFVLNTTENEVIITHNYVSIQKFYKDIIVTNPSRDEMILCEDVYPKEHLFNAPDGPWAYSDMSDEIKLVINPFLATQIESLRRAKTILLPFLNTSRNKLRLKPEITVVKFGLIMRIILENMVVIRKGKQKETVNLITEFFMDNDGNSVEGNLYRYLFDTTPYENAPAFDKNIEFFTTCATSARVLRNKLFQDK